MLGTVHSAVSAAFNKLKMCFKYVGEIKYTQQSQHAHLNCLIFFDCGVNGLYCPTMQRLTEMDELLETAKRENIVDECFQKAFQVAAWSTIC